MKSEFEKLEVLKKSDAESFVNKNFQNLNQKFVDHKIETKNSLEYLSTELEKMKEFNQTLSNQISSLLQQKDD